MGISVVIPANNEADSIELLLYEIRSVLDGLCEYEIIYVDDGSTDNTQEVLKRVRRQQPPLLRILQLAQSCGQSTAILVGIRAAASPWVVTLDADRQNNPADIPRLLSVISNPDNDSGVGLVCGYRRDRRDSWLKRWTSVVANRVRHRVLQDNTADTGCGLKLISRDLFLELPYFDHMHRFLPALVHRAGFRVKITEVDHRPRLTGCSHYGIHDRLWTGIIDLLGVVWLLRRNKRPEVNEV